MPLRRLGAPLERVMDTARKGTGPKRYVRGSILSDSYYHDSACRFFRHKIDCGRDEM